eukprot:CAMPEP_0118804750 /NCGR_PEP_ID=MMETSP1161-20130426/24309_1 /TAXON_ID=249345 /ORGANISM="Picochlorum oklahomensis, Strain CCMP2329" /LENGTH=141 /DNA_ID=CAMNT_0006733557 /DNA_START=27 /DNA_END=448 /DNA_ORIENTATION=-
MAKLTLEEIAKHNTEKDCWIIFKGKVYEVSDYLEDHPGGVEIITDLAGQDCTEDFEDVGHSQEAYDQLEDYYIGDVDGDSVEAGVEVVQKIEVETKPVKPVVVESKPVSVPKPVYKQPKKAESDDNNMLLIAGGVAAVAAL